MCQCTLGYTGDGKDNCKGTLKISRDNELIIQETVQSLYRNVMITHPYPNPKLTYLTLTHVG